MSDSEITEEVTGPEILIPKKNVIFDATVFTTVDACARKMDLQYNHNFQPQGGKSNALETGNICHKIAETYYKCRIDGIPHAQAVGFAIISGELYVRGCPKCTGKSKGEPTECGHLPNEYPGVMNTPMDDIKEPSRVGWRTVLDTMQQYFEHYKSDQWIPLQVEKVLSKIIYEDDNIRVMWKAKLDLLVDTVTPYGITSVDHKSSRVRRKISKLNVQFMGQCIVTEQRGMFKNNIGFQTSLKPAEKFTREYFRYTADALDEFKNEIVPVTAYKMLDYNESGYYPPNFNACDTKFGPCIFQSVCESNRNQRAEELRIGFQVGEPWNPTNEIGE